MWIELILVGIFICTLLMVGNFVGVVLIIFGNIILIIAFFNYIQRLGRYRDQKSKSEYSSIVLNLRAPLIEDCRRILLKSSKKLLLGDRIASKPFKIVCLIHNISIRSFKNINFDIKYNKSILELSESSVEIPQIESGEIRKFEISIRPLTQTKRSTSIHIILSWDGGRSEKTLIIRSIFNKGESHITRIRVNRWKHGLYGGFVWRADIDAFCNLFNHEIFLPAIELSRRFGVPPSIFISGRLCLDYNEWEKWVEHFPEKFSLRYPTKKLFEEFRDFLKTIKVNDIAEYPLYQNRSFTAQIGCHMYHHYYGYYGFGACEANDWKILVQPGEGFYPWENEPPESKSRLTEMRDNLLKNRKLLKNVLGVVPKTWAAPGNMPDFDLPRILEDVGILGASEAYPREKKLPNRSLIPYHPKSGVISPYHPPSSNIIETQAHTYRFDPHTVTQVVCIKKSIKLALKTNRQLVLVMHPHLRLYSPFFGENNSVCHFEEILRHLVEDKGSAIWITTHYNIVKYWEDVLCEVHRKIRLRLIRDGRILEISNNGNQKLESIPVDLELSGRKRTTFLVDIEPKSTVRIEL